MLDVEEFRGGIELIPSRIAFQLLFLVTDELVLVIAIHLQNLNEFEGV